MRETRGAIFRADAHAGRDATADENVIARSVVCDEAISFVDREIASQTALAMTCRAIFRTDAHAGRGATADENVIARSVLCDEAISFVDGEIASQTMS